MGYGIIYRWHGWEYGGYMWVPFKFCRPYPKNTISINISVRHVWMETRGLARVCTVSWCLDRGYTHKLPAEFGRMRNCEKFVSQRKNHKNPRKRKKGIQLGLTKCFKRRIPMESASLAICFRFMNWFVLTISCNFCTASCSLFARKSSTILPVITWGIHKTSLYLTLREKNKGAKCGSVPEQAPRSGEPCWLV